MNIPQEIGAAYDETTGSLVGSVVGTASAKGRSYTAPRRIWEKVIDEDTGVLRVVLA